MYQSNSNKNLCNMQIIKKGNKQDSFQKRCKKLTSLTLTGWSTTAFSWTSPYKQPLSQDKNFSYQETKYKKVAATTTTTIENNYHSQPVDKSTFNALSQSFAFILTIEQRSKWLTLKLKQKKNYPIKNLLFLPSAAHKAATFLNR